MTQQFLLIEGAELGFGNVNIDSEHTADQPYIIVESSSTIKTHKAPRETVGLLPLLKGCGIFGSKATFCYYITSVPKTLAECQEELGKMALGLPRVDWFHRYSDLTGYLWTTTRFEVQGHDLNAEFMEAITRLRGKWINNKNDYRLAGYENKVYLTLELRTY